MFAIAVQTARPNLLTFFEVPHGAGGVGVKYAKKNGNFRNSMGNPGT